MERGVFFRLDWSSQLGFGHLFRAKSFAKSLGIKLRVISDSNAHLIPFKDDIEVMSIASAQKRISKNDWIVTDSYEIPIEEEKMWFHKNHVLAIDDNGTKFRWCHRLLDYAMANKEHYLDLTPPGTEFFLGTKYLMIHPNFQKGGWHFKHSMKDILVTLGGGDHHGDTYKFLEANQTFLKPYQVTCVIGPGFQKNCIEKLKEGKERWDFSLRFIQSNQLWEEYKKTDACVGAFGVSSWERIWMGLPSFNITIADNQEYNKKIQVDAGLVEAQSFENFLNKRGTLHLNCLTYCNNISSELKTVFA